MRELQSVIYFTHTGACVFISHKKEDEEAAIHIGNYLMNTVGVGIYLDTKDCELKKAMGEDNGRKIVDSII